jgi:hypothetical protein
MIHLRPVAARDQQMLYKRFLYPLVAWMLASTCVAQAQTEPPKLAPSDSVGSDSSGPGAIFKRLHDYVKNSQLDFETSFDARSQGDELYRGTAHFQIRQPNLLRIETASGDHSYLTISDGKVLTIYNPHERKFAQMPAPDSPAAAFGLLTGEMGVESQVLDFLRVVDDVVAGSGDVKLAAAGSGTIGGRQCDKFTVVERMGDNRWEAWLEKSEVPLLCKLVYQNVDGPAQTNEFSWKPNPVFSQDTFVFSPPEGSTKVDVGSLGLSPP